MTEKKRYTYIDVSNNDTMGSFFCNGEHLSNQKVVELLNENEQLKQENKKLIYLMDSEIQKNTILSEKNNSLKIKNMRMKKQNKYKQPSCKNCIYFSTDGTGNYCMNEKGLLGEKGEMFPFTWSYKKGAKECKQYNDEKELFNELINLIKDIIFKTEYEQSYSTPICKVSLFVTPEMYKILSEKMKEVNK